MRPAESNTFITFRIIIFSVDLDGRYSQRAEDIYAPIAEARRAPRRRERSARSVPRSASFFCSEAAFNLQLTRRLIRREPREPEEGETRETLLLSRYAKWVALAHWAGARDVSYRLPFMLRIYMGAKSTSPTARPLAPRGNDLAPPPSIVNAVENEICPLSLSLSRRRAS